MTPLEIAGVILMSIVGLAFIPTIIEKFTILIKTFRLQHKLNKSFKQLEKNMEEVDKEQLRKEFFESIEKIKKENKEDK